MDETDFLIEKLAELEHEQWMKWSQNIASVQDASISDGRRARWKDLWKPYSQLTEEQKEQDRIWARKVLDITDSYYKKNSIINYELLKNDTRKLFKTAKEIKEGLEKEYGITATVEFVMNVIMQMVIMP